MHVGRLYPYADFFWQNSVFFWPGYTPRKTVLEVPPGNGIWSTIIGAGIVSDVMIPDATVAGWSAYKWSQYTGVYSIDLQFFPPIPTVQGTLAQVTIIEIATGKTALCEGFYPPFMFRYRPPVWSHYRNDFGPIPCGGFPVFFRAARWDEV